MKKDYPATYEGNSFSFIDLETGSKRACSSIASIGITTVDINRKALSELYINVDLNTGLNTQRLTDEDTLSWWSEQDDAVRNEALAPSNPVTLEVALEAVADYIANLRDRGNAYVFGNGSEFDIAIMFDAYAQMGMEEPWDFRHVHSVRTVVLLSELALDVNFKRSNKFVGQRHHALHDARHEASYSMDSISALRFSVNKQ